jgi:hypothetical protein
MSRSLVCCLALAVGIAAGAPAQGIRVVDSVVVAANGDEAVHQFAGTDTATGSAQGRTWRRASGWFSYTLRIYDDSPLTIVCVVADGDGGAEAFDVLVDGRRAASFTREGSQAKAAELKVRLNLRDTEGRTAVSVKLAAHPGANTARLLELRTVQEHLE